MSLKERAIELIGQIPDSKMYYVLTFLEGAAIPDEAPIIQPDDWDLQMIAEAKQENDGNAVSISELADDLGIAL